jgi:hypothetical protein
MFCPLCQAEYRKGFTQCNDCHIGLTASLEEAQDAAVLLWEGRRQKVVDLVLEALAQQEIPSHFKEAPKPQPDPLGLNKLAPLVPMALEFNLRYEVWVLKEDLEKALSATSGILEIK